MSEDWDVEQYKTFYESDEHWELRKMFLEKHKDNFTEDELLCLAQVFTNVEFLGCRYPPETMEQISHLAKGIVEDYRKSREGMLKRTFVSAQNAAQQRYAKK